MTIAIPTVVALAIGALILVRFAGMRLWHGAICVLLGVYLGTTPIGGVARALITGIVHALSSIA